MLSVLQGAIFVYTDRSFGQAPPELVLLVNGDVFWLPAVLLTPGVPRRRGAPSIKLFACTYRKLRPTVLMVQATETRWTSRCRQ